MLERRSGADREGKTGVAAEQEGMKGREGYERDGEDSEERSGCGIGYEETGMAGTGIRIVMGKETERTVKRQGQERQRSEGETGKQRTSKQEI